MNQNFVFLITFPRKCQVDKMRAHDPYEKEMVREKKDERIQEADLDKQQARFEHAAERQAGTGPGTRTGLGTGTGTGTNTYDPTVGGR